MNRSVLYDDDILEWSEQQADALRRVAQTRRDVSNEVDWEHVAEEIEDVGRSEFTAVKSFIRLILVHLIKAISVPDHSSLLHWRKEVVAFHRDLLDRITPSMHGRIDLDSAWRQAIKQADADLAVYGQEVAASLPKRCPVGMDDILAQDFDLIATAETLRKRIGP